MLKSPAQTLWSLLSEEDTLSIGNDGFPPLTSQESLVLHSSKQAPSIGVKHLTFQTNTRWKKLLLDDDFRDFFDLDVELQHTA